MESVVLTVAIVSAAISLVSLVLMIILLTRKNGEGKELPQQIDNKLENLQRAVSQRISESEISQAQNQQNALSNFGKQVEDLRTEQNRQLNAMRETVEKRIDVMQESNTKKLEEIRNTVDEKLQKTLEERFNQSFKLVNDGLSQVSVKIGEMQTLATGVGDLKKILSNVKTRGIFGEIQLDRILEQILTSDQYDKNVRTKRGSNDPVEFAIRLPRDGKTDDPVYLPIDAKFPLDKYEALCNASESGDKALLDEASKDFERFIKLSAKSIKEKYIDPPNTTNFALMFLPTESIYAEVAKRTELVEFLSREYNVNISGPSTVSAVLNSLQMGFRTLAIEQRSNEVWELLGAVKTEFGTFTTCLAKVKDKLSAADKELDTLMTTRTNVMSRKLRNIEALSSDDARAVLETGYDDE